jgi:hypothetical protein
MRSRAATRLQPHPADIRFCNLVAEADYVSVYSGPEPPSGGVNRPPFAVMAPH